MVIIGACLAMQACARHRWRMLAGLLRFTWDFDESGAARILYGAGKGDC